MKGDLILEITDGPLKGERRKVQRKCATIGRSPDNTLSVSDPELSRRHSRIEFDESDGKVGEKANRTGRVFGQSVDATVAGGLPSAMR
jgi:pSer/pThr/pTyr-binding forkhead associated (FHA) protein